MIKYEHIHSLIFMNSSSEPRVFSGLWEEKRRTGMKKKLLALLLACTALFTAGCGSIGTNSSQWIDSSIKGNVSADTVVSLKDDFAAAANQDLYVSGELEGRTIVNISRMITDRKRALLSDASVTGKGGGEKSPQDVLIGILRKVLHHLPGESVLA